MWRNCIRQTATLHCKDGTFSFDPVALSALQQRSIDNERCVASPMHFPALRARCGIVDSLSKS